MERPSISIRAGLLALLCVGALSACDQQTMSPTGALTPVVDNSPAEQLPPAQPVPISTPRPTRTPTPAPTPTHTVTPTPTPTSTPTPTPTSTGGVALDNEEAAFVTLINDYRAQSGLAKLEVSITLTESSKWMSSDMASKNYFSHTDSLGRDPFARMAAFGYPQNGYSGENIAAGNSDAQNTFTQWKNSPGHNANMLGVHYTVIGVGRAPDSKSTYKWYWTTDFGSTVDAILK
jgi:uncharacterized protein YkwD